MNIDQIISEALHEDIGNGDHTSLSTIPNESIGKAQLLVKEDGVLAGVEIAQKVFMKVDPEIQINILINDGSHIKKGDIIFVVEGRSISIVMAERLALNFMQRMSGIATATNKMVSKLQGLNCKVLDTRKTTPLLRELEKMAVRLGGGDNHRMGLYDMILIKDNHIDFAGGIKNAIYSTKEYLNKHKLNIKIEIEARNLNEVKEIISVGGIDRIMLDNFSYPELRKTVQMINGKYETEASGGITLDTVLEYAKCGVDFVSVGSLTHHINSIDMSLKAV
ncbi:carboxylating nicotinate-nucleotide diphosphorylase [candidate division KSB1 bacterium]